MPKINRPTKLPSQPWLAICEFPAFDDAKAFQALVAECLNEQAQVRRKLEYRKQGAFAEWRTTKIFRKAFVGRSFNAEMLAEAAINNGYCGTRSAISSWLRKATEESIVQKVGPGEWEFTQCEAP
jgi:hypothetical protein